MEREQRSALQRAVVAARRLLEREAADQLEGLYSILPDGRVLDAAPGDPVVRRRLLDLVAHHRAGGASARDAVARVARECAFTTLNRLAALKMAERRGLVPACVAPLRQGVGMQQLGDCAPGLADAFEDRGQRLLIETVMDELSLDLSVLFDRRAPTGLLWPRPKALGDLLELLNAPELEALWSEDETIGWMYQYFNADDVREMRRASDAPRSSRELAVRNQFFTPRYVVEFLVDNTLGRIWLDMRRGATVLTEQCPMLVYTPEELTAIGTTERAELRAAEPPAPGYGSNGLERAPMDPRDLRVLDPAVGSGHFLLYAFDLLETIYREAWEADTPPSEATGRRLREDYPDARELARAAPGLILRHNLYGIEIDPRAAQIAALALWLRAQRAFQEQGLEPAQRPAIERVNIVVAEPMPGDESLLEGFLACLEPEPLRDLVRRIWREMRLADEVGSLLKLERHLADAVKEAERTVGALFAASEEGFWRTAEDRVRAALAQLAREANEGHPDRARLFAEDAERGIAFIDVCRERFDVVVMNPPFGAASRRAKTYIDKMYPRTKNDLYAAFVERGLEWLRPGGRLGAITSRTGFFLTTFQRWREEILLGEARPVLVADLGYGVMDEAMVEAAAYVLERPATDRPEGGPRDPTSKEDVAR